MISIKLGWLFLPETLTPFASSLSKSPTQTTVLSVEVNRYVFSQGWGKLIYLPHYLAKEFSRIRLYPNSSSKCPCLGKTLSQHDYFSLGIQTAVLWWFLKRVVSKWLVKTALSRVLSLKPWEMLFTHTPLGIAGSGCVSGFSLQPLGASAYLYWSDFNTYVRKRMEVVNEQRRELFTEA